MDVFNAIKIIPREFKESAFERKIEGTTNPAKKVAEYVRYVDFLSKRDGDHHEKTMEVSYRAAAACLSFREILERPSDLASTSLKGPSRMDRAIGNTTRKWTIEGVNHLFATFALRALPSDILFGVGSPWSQQNSSTIVRVDLQDLPERPFTEREADTFIFLAQLPATIVSESVMDAALHVCESAPGSVNFRKAEICRIYAERLANLDNPSPVSLSARNARALSYAERACEFAEKAQGQEYPRTICPALAPFDAPKLAQRTDLGRAYCILGETLQRMILAKLEDDDTLVDRSSLEHLCFGAKTAYEKSLECYSQTAYIDMEKEGCESKRALLGLGVLESLIGNNGDSREHLENAEDLPGYIPKKALQLADQTFASIQNYRDKTPSAALWHNYKANAAFHDILMVRISSTRWSDQHIESLVQDGGGRKLFA